MQIDGNPAPVIFYRNPILAENHHVDFGTKAGQRLINGVIDDFGHQMMESALGGVADIHARALADRLEPFEHADRVSAVAVRNVFVWHRNKKEGKGPLAPE